MSRYKTSVRSSIKGFTLIELMVSLTVFAIVMMVSTGSLLTFIDANAKAQAVYEATTNLSFALDSMTREIRTGYSYNCPSGTLSSTGPLPTGTHDCTNGNAIAFFREKDNAHYGYRLNNDRIEQKIESGSWSPLTSSNVVIDVFNLVVSDTATYDSGGNLLQPTVALTIKGHVNNGLDTDTDFNIQTRIVQRKLDIY